jgi:hypothetical protein
MLTTYIITDFSYLMAPEAFLGFNNDCRVRAWEKPWCLKVGGKGFVQGLLRHNIVGVPMSIRPRSWKSGSESCALYE